MEPAHLFAAGQASAGLPDFQLVTTAVVLVFLAGLASMTDAQTSDKARMVLPPLTGSTDFDPGTVTFGVWVYTDQLSQKYDTGGTASNGDYDYSEDAPNSPANVHRTKVYPLKDATGGTVAGSFLLAVEEAGNGDYQDYVFVLSNVMVAP